MLVNNQFKLDDIYLKSLLTNTVVLEIGCPPDIAKVINGKSIELFLDDNNFFSLCRDFKTYDMNRCEDELLNDLKEANSKSQTNPENPQLISARLTNFTLENFKDLMKTYNCFESDYCRFRNFVGKLHLDLAGTARENCEPICNTLLSLFGHLNTFIIDDPNVDFIINCSGRKITSMHLNIKFDFVQSEVSKYKLNFLNGDVKDLKSLKLESPNITDANIGQLSAFVNLKILLLNTSISQNGISELKKALANTIVIDLS